MKHMNYLLNSLPDFAMNSIVKKEVVLVVASTMFALTGCDNRVSLAEQEMAEIRASDPQEIEKPPQPEVVQDFVYSADEERSPFMPPSLLNNELDSEQNNGIKPDLTRTKDELEQFDISELVYRGLVVAPDGKQHGLIQRPDGSIVNVVVGDYMGRDYGRIVEITATQINLIEIVPDNRSGFVEKPQSLVSPSS